MVVASGMRRGLVPVARRDAFTGDVMATPSAT
jgi:hypothetical protein